MGFFGEFDVWLTNLLARYITDNTAAMARVLEPAIVTLGVLYIVVWGYMHLMGKIEQPFIEGVKRLLTMALILGVSLQFWLYNEVIVNTFFSAPASLAAGVIGAPTREVQSAAFLEPKREAAYSSMSVLTISTTASAAPSDQSSSWMMKL